MQILNNRHSKCVVARVLSRNACCMVLVSELLVGLVERTWTIDQQALLDLNWRTRSIKSKHKQFKSFLSKKHQYLLCESCGQHWRDNPGINDTLGYWTRRLHINHRTNIHFSVSYPILSKELQTLQKAQEHALTWGAHPTWVSFTAAVPLPLSHRIPSGGQIFMHAIWHGFHDFPQRPLWALWSRPQSSPTAL